MTAPSITVVGMRESAQHQSESEVLVPMTAGTPYAEAESQTTTEELDMQTIARLPEPAKTHATCAWCRCSFDRIVDLIDHVDHGHLDPISAAPNARRAA